jgi:hypothetical protein
MILETLWDSIKQAWAYVPLPWPFLALILLGFAWLWVEYQTTRVARALPFWRRPVPLFPQISLGFGWMIRISRGLLIFWIILFAMLTINFLASARVPDYPPAVDRLVTGAGRIWHQGYAFLTDQLPNETPGWLLPPMLEEAKQKS